MHHHYHHRHRRTLLLLGAFATQCNVEGYATEPPHLSAAAPRSTSEYYTVSLSTQTKEGRTANSPATTYMTASPNAALNKIHAGVFCSLHGGWFCNRTVSWVDFAQAAGDTTTITVHLLPPLNLSSSMQRTVRVTPTRAGISIASVNAAKGEITFDIRNNGSPQHLQVEWGHRTASPSAPSDGGRPSDIREPVLADIVVTPFLPRICLRTLMDCAAPPLKRGTTLPLNAVTCCSLHLLTPPLF